MVWLAAHPRGASPCFPPSFTSFSSAEGFVALVATSMGMEGGYGPHPRLVFVHAPDCLHYMGVWR
jgi:hypothetical protein